MPTLPCLNCGKNLEQNDTKKAKKYCNSTCRSNHWQKEQRIKAKSELFPNELPQINTSVFDKISTKLQPVSSHVTNHIIEGTKDEDYESRIKALELELENCPLEKSQGIKTQISLLKHLL